MKNIYSIGIFENPKRRDSPMHASPILVTILDKKIRRTRYSIQSDFSIERIQEIGDDIFDIDHAFHRKSYLFHEPLLFDSRFQTLYIQGKGVVYGKNKILFSLKVSIWCLIHYKNQSLNMYLCAIKNIFSKN